METSGGAAHELVARVAPELGRSLARYLRLRYRLPASDIDDLVQQALTDLAAYLLAREAALPAPAEVSALGVAILRRRVADRFRAAARQAVAYLPADEAGDLHTDDGATERVARYRQLLQAVLGLLTELSDADRALLLRDQFPEQEPAQPLSVAERKRLSRLRAELRDRVTARFGASPEELLRG